MARWSCVVVGVLMVLSAACGDGADERDRASGTSGGEQVSDQRFPDIVAVDATQEADNGTWTFEVKVSSPYDSPERYADGWRILGPNGTVYGEHELAHDHASEQPFTRTQTGVAVPDGVDEVTVEGRDLRHGYGGQTRTVGLRRPSEPS